MKNLNFKKALSIILVVFMLFTAVPAGVFAAEASYPMMEAYNSASSADYHKYYNKVYSVTFLDSIDETSMNATDTVDKWDVSAVKDGSVMAWMKKNATNSSLYDVYIAGNGGVGANPDSSWIFYMFSALTEVNGLENFKTDKVTTFFRIFEKCSALKTLDMSSFNTSNLKNMNYMFSECKSLESVDFSNWDTSNVTTMSYTFNNCHVLKELDLSSFNTSKVTNMSHLFFNCHELAAVYVGDGWKIDQVTNGGSVFNCCYALMGGEDSYDSGKTDIKYATTASGGLLKPESEKPVTEKYTVTYSFTGEYPADAVLPDAVEYEKGTTVVVEADSVSQDATYVFNGWTTEDVDITTGSFTIENDVEIVGSWTKLYKVTYEYIGTAPTDATALPMPESYKAGDKVDVADLATAYGYTFSGWTTDVSITDGNFTMPARDVVLKGYFKKTVDGVEIKGGDIELKDGEDVTIKVVVTPDNGIGKEVEYKSSDETIVTVDSNGKITALGEGEAFIIVTSKDDSTKSDMIKVTVYKEYDVTYEFKGTTIPENVKVPEKTTHKSGSDVSVEVNPTADGYIFSGWSTENANVQDGSFIINNDVKFVGEWTKLYKVSYAYDSEYAKPVGAPNVPDSATYKAGEKVTVKNALLLPNYDFTGWYSKDTDVDIADGEFIMPERDITLYGRFEKSIVPVDGITVDKNDINLEIGDKEKITVTVTPDDATEKGVTYESSDETVVKVDENGNIEAVGDGEATITVTSKADSSKKVSIKIKVKKPVVPVEKVEADKTEFDLEIGDKEKITVTVTPDDATEKGVTYESSDETVVKVDENGNIEAVGEGEATITATSKADSSKKVSIKIKVKKPYISVDDVTADKTEFDLEVGGKDTIKVTVTPDNATEKGVTYESSDEEVVKVDENGNIEAISEGEATITVTSKADGTKKATVKVKVKKPYISVDDVTADKTEFDLEVGGKDTIIVTVTPDDATDKGVTYESSDEDVVKVDENGNIEAISEGEATITVTSKADGTKKATVKVKVNKPAETPDVDEPDIDEPEVNYIMEYPMSVVVKEGETKNLGVKVLPEEGAPAVKYTSSDESIVTVDADGNITGVAEGTATVTAELPGGNIAVITVTVTFKTSHYIVFGKTEKIGWYSVSMDGGETFMVVFGNSNLEVAEGTELIIRANDVLGDPFTFYINGEGTTPDENGYVRVVVDGYMLIGALGVPVIAPDTEESLSLIQRLIKSIREFFAKIASWFGF